MIVADELEADWRRVTIQQGLGDKKYGDQNTDGSHSIRSFYEPMREAGATARTMLESAAATKWGVPAARVPRQESRGGSRRQQSQSWALANWLRSRQSSRCRRQETLKFKSPSEFATSARTCPITDLDGHRRRQAPRSAWMRACPGWSTPPSSARPSSAASSRAWTTPKRARCAAFRKPSPSPRTRAPWAFQPLGGVAVIADNTWAAMQGRKKLKVDWDLGPNADYDSAAYKKQLLDDRAREPASRRATMGDVDAAFAKASKVHEAHITCRISRTLPWSRPWRWPNSRTAR